MNKRLFMFVTNAAMVVLFGTIFVLADVINTNEKIMYSEKYYMVYDITKDNQPEYRYEILNEKGNIVKNETVWRVCPKIEYLDDNTLISIEIGVGTGTWLTQYYDVNNDLFSEVFESPAIEKYGKVVFINISEDKPILIVRDIFNKTEYFEEFVVDFSPVANPVDALKNVEFLDENTLKISYLSGNGYDEQTTTLQLN